MGRWEGEKVGKCEGSNLAAPSKGMVPYSRVVARFEDLEVWQTGRELARAVYRAARTQALAHDRVLSSQMKRAALSISSNIAEGFERGTRKQQIEFCYIAKGSAGELRSQILIAHDVGGLDDTAYQWFLAACEKCSRQLSGYIRHLKNTARAIPGPKYAGGTTPKC